MVYPRRVLRWSVTLPTLNTFQPPGGLKTNKQSCKIKQTKSVNNTIFGKKQYCKYSIETLKIQSAVSWQISRSKLLQKDTRYLGSISPTLWGKAQMRALAHSLKSKKMPYQQNFAQLYWYTQQDMPNI